MAKNKTLDTNAPKTVLYQPVCNSYGYVPETHIACGYDGSGVAI